MVNGIRISMNMAATTVILIIALFAIAPAVSALLAELSVEDQTGESDVIAIGNIKEVESMWGLRSPGIHTYSTLYVEKYIKGGEGQETLTIITEGGSKWGFNVWVEDVPTFTKNETVLVFLKRAGREFSVVGWAQGKHIVENGEVRGISGEKTSLDDFIRQIKDALPLSSSAAPIKSPETPGFEAIIGFMGLLVARHLLMR